MTGSREVFISMTRTAGGIEKQSVGGKVARMECCAKWSCRLASGLLEEHWEGLYPTNCLVPITGEHRGLGAGVSKVRSLKMDRKVWTETLIQVGMPCLSPMLGVSPLSLN